MSLYNKIFGKVRNGARVQCKISSLVIRNSKIRFTDGRAYLCQNSKKGAVPQDGNKLGYMYSWVFNRISDSQITDFKIIDEGRMVLKKNGKFFQEEKCDT